ncbi:MAG TPA: GNAT family N-acetyltransferase [Planctomycetaceae bacterium]|nr:GNAT family N-acetyltransferase [Planctomycetaceae bacterium]
MPLTLSKSFDWSGDVVSFRTFRNSDPPHLVKLWHVCQLGRGAAEGFRCDALEGTTLSKTYFDRQGLITAWDDETGTLVGFVHAGFGSLPDQSGLDRSIGVVCVVMVHPEFRRRGIGRELIQRAEQYLAERGATTIRGGACPPHDPFYVGLYGGVKPAGFLESDPHARPFVESLGYKEIDRRAIYFRDSERAKSPMNMQIMSLRRRMQLGVTDVLPNKSWWNQCRFANLDYIRFLLQPKSGEDPVAGVTIVNLDVYLGKWGRRIVGMTDVYVVDSFRGQGVGSTLITEVCRRLKNELIVGAEAHTGDNDEAAIKLLENAGFYRVDTGIVYEKKTE